MTTTPAAPLLSLEHVEKHFGDLHVLRDINLAVERGEVVVVLGPSGSGKSTLLRTINRLETIDSGRIVIAGEEQPAGGPALDRLRARVGMVFQQFNLLPELTVLENVTLGPVRVRKVAPDAASALAHDLLRRVGVENQAGKRPAELSGGQQQRVAIARALAMEPELILFDEPTSALDPEMVGEVLAVMEGLARDGMTMLVVTHEIGFARRVAHRIVFMADGAVVEDAPADEFFAAPETERAREFLGRVLPR